MKHYARTLGIVFSITLNLAFLGSYAYRAWPRQDGYVFEELRLTPEQRSRMIAGRDRFTATIGTIGTSILGLQVQMIDAIAADPEDRPAIDATIGRIRSQQQAMQLAVVDHLLQDKSLLTPDQRQEFFSILKARIVSQGAPRPAWMPRDRQTP
jgi:Spy/CpxP family protein refolding chaperone